jgi:hypothetical protein
MYLVVDYTCVFLCTMLGQKVGKLKMNTPYTRGSHYWNFRNYVR